VLPAVNKGDANSVLGYPDDTGPTQSGNRVTLSRLTADYKIESSKAVDENGESRPAKVAIVLSLTSITLTVTN
jgi:hypothetical protein